MDKFVDGQMKRAVCMRIGIQKMPKPEPTYLLQLNAFQRKNNDNNGFAGGQRVIKCAECDVFDGGLYLYQTKETECPPQFHGCSVYYLRVVPGLLPDLS